MLTRYGRRRGEVMSEMGLKERKSEGSLGKGRDGNRKGNRREVESRKDKKGERRREERGEERKERGEISRGK